MKQAYLIDGIRTPIGTSAGRLAPRAAAVLGTFDIEKLMRRKQSVDTEALVDVIPGCTSKSCNKVY